jgi:hypothetical protein
MVIIWAILFSDLPLKLSDLGLAVLPRLLACLVLRSTCNELGIEFKVREIYIKMQFL